MVTTIVPHLSNSGIDAYFLANSVLPYGWYRDGNPWILLSGLSTSCSLFTYNPPLSNSLYALNGAMLSPRGNAASGSSPAQGFHGLTAYASSLTVQAGATIQKGDVLITSFSYPFFGGQYNRPTRNWPPISYPKIKMMTPFTFVSSVPGVDDFRPSPYGSRTNRFSKSYSSFDISKLANGPIPYPTGNSSIDNLSFAQSINDFKDFGGFPVGGDFADELVPVDQHIGGPYLASAVVNAVTLCLLDRHNGSDNADRADLAYKLTQWGIDLWGAYKDGRQVSLLSKEARSHKLLIMFAGFMLNDASMMNPTGNLYLLGPISGNFSDTGRFIEDMQYYGPEGTVVSSLSSVYYGGRWIFNEYAFSGSPYNERNWQKQLPSTWGTLNMSKFTAPLGSPYVINKYREAYDIAALAMFMGLGTQYGKKPIGYLTQTFYTSNKAIAESFKSLNNNQVYNYYRNGEKSNTTPFEFAANYDFLNSFSPISKTDYITNDYILSAIDGKINSNVNYVPSYLHLWTRYRFSDKAKMNGVLDYTPLKNSETIFAPSGSVSGDNIVRNYSYYYGASNVLTTHDQTSYGQFVLEGYNCPSGSTVAATLLFVGDRIPTYDFGGTDMDVAPGGPFTTVQISNPNEYGHLLHTIDMSEFLTSYLDDANDVNSQMFPREAWMQLLFISNDPLSPQFSSTNAMKVRLRN